MATKKKTAGAGAKKRAAPRPKPMTLHAVMLAKLCMMYDVEHEIAKALPKMIKKARDADLKKGLEAHYRETEGQVVRLESAFASLGEKPKKIKSAAIRGMTADAETLLKQAGSPEAGDVIIIAAAQEIEHHEIAAYGALRTWANEMGHAEAERLFGETLVEEETANELLTTLAENGVNERANDMGAGSADLETDVDAVARTFS